MNISDKYIFLSYFQVKGFTLNHAASRLINFESQRRLIHRFVEDGVQEKLEIREDAIRRLADHQIVTKVVKKRYQVVFNKRRVLRDFSTLPYGY